MEKPRLCWAVHDGRAGNRNQALSLAEAAAAFGHMRVEERILTAPGGAAGPARRLGLRLGLTRDPALTPPWPHVWIACGAAVVGASAAMRRWSGGRTFTVQILNPHRSLRDFDLVVAPAHDGLSGPNVISMLGAPNRVTPERLKDAEAHFAAELARLPAPRAAVLIGGKSKRHRMDRASLATLADALSVLRDQGASLLVTTSRRTPAAAHEILSGLRGRDRVWLHDPEDSSIKGGENPYFAFLAAADVVLATRDSVNMLTEAASAGKPVLTLPAAGRDGKLAALYRSLEQRGHARPFVGKLEIWDAPVLDETARTAREIVDRASIL